MSKDNFNDLKKASSDKSVAHAYIERVSIENITEILEILKSSAEKFEKKALLPNGLSLEYSSVRLFNIAVSYLHDVHRFIDFHGCSDFITDEKQLAFLWKWVAKIKPFSCAPAKETVEFFYFQNLVNSLYCMSLFNYILNKNPSDFFDTYTMVYELHYGEPTVNSLMAIFER
jgi:hypothetical protein